MGLTSQLAHLLPSKPQVSVSLALLRVCRRFITTPVWCLWIMWSYLTFLPCEVICLHLYLKRHHSTTGFWVNGSLGFLFLFPPLFCVFPQFLHSRLRLEWRRTHQRDIEAPPPPDRSPHRHGEWMPNYSQMAWLHTNSSLTNVH